MVLQNHQRNKTIDFIPDKILVEIISFLDYRDLGYLSRTCERMYLLIKKYLEMSIQEEEKQQKQERISNYRNSNPVIVQKISEEYPSLTKKKRQALKETRCILCGNIKREILLRPCNHLIYCSQCASKLENCFECGRKIEQKELVNWKPTKESNSSGIMKRSSAKTEFGSEVHTKDIKITLKKTKK